MSEDNIPSNLPDEQLDTQDVTDYDKLRDNVIESIKTVYDPEIPVNIFELGLIYSVVVSGDNHAEVVMTLTSPGCFAAGMIPGEVEEKVLETPGIKSVHVELTFEPPWDQTMMSEEARFELGFW